MNLLALLNATAHRIAFTILVEFILTTMIYCNHRESTFKILNIEGNRFSQVITQIGEIASLDTYILIDQKFMIKFYVLF